MLYLCKWLFSVVMNFVVGLVFVLLLLVLVDIVVRLVMDGGLYVCMLLVWMCWVSMWVEVVDVVLLFWVEWMGWELVFLVMFWVEFFVSVVNLLVGFLYEEVVVVWLRVFCLVFWWVVCEICDDGLVL